MQAQNVLPCCCRLNCCQHTTSEKDWLLGRSCAGFCMVIQQSCCGLYRAADSLCFSMNRVSSALANTASSSSHLSMADSCTYRRTSEAAVALGTLLYLLIIYSVIITLCDEYLTSHALCIMVPLIAFKRRIVGLVSAFSIVG